MKRTEHTQKWLDALRSGEYEQGRGQLRDENNNFCCLGVMCDLVSPNDWVDVEGFYYHGKEERQYNYPNEEIIRQAGVSGDEAYELARLNDSVQLTFPQMADEIEKMLDVS